jgi:hypothetical protein
MLPHHREIHRFFLIFFSQRLKHLDHHQILQSYCTCSLLPILAATLYIFSITKCCSLIVHVDHHQILQSHCICSLLPYLVVILYMFIATKSFSHTVHVHCYQILQSHCCVLRKPAPEANFDLLFLGASW